MKPLYSPAEVQFRVMKEEPEGHHWSSMPSYKRHMAIKETSKGPYLRVSHTIAENPTEDGVQWIKLPFRPGEKCYLAETWVKLLAVSPATDQPLEIGPGERLIEPPTSWTDDKGHVHWHYNGVVIAYREDSNIEFCDADGGMGDFADKEDMPHWQSPITMPAKFARRFFVIVSCVPVKVSEVTEEDAIKAGFDSGYYFDQDGSTQNTTSLDNFLFNWHQRHPRKEWTWRIAIEPSGIDG